MPFPLNRGRTAGAGQFLAIRMENQTADVRTIPPQPENG